MLSQLRTAILFGIFFVYGINYDGIRDARATHDHPATVSCSRNVPISLDYYIDCTPFGIPWGTSRMEYEKLIGKPDKIKKNVLSDGTLIWMYYYDRFPGWEHGDPRYYNPSKGWRLHVRFLENFGLRLFELKGESFPIMEGLDTQDNLNCAKSAIMYTDRSSAHNTLNYKLPNRVSVGIWGERVTPPTLTLSIRARR